MAEHLPFNLRPRLDFGGFWQRAAASVIDGVILFVPIALASYTYRVLLFDSETISTFPERYVDALVTWLAWSIYSVLFWLSAWEATPGKKLCGLLVRSADGTKLGFEGGVARMFAMLLSGFVLIGPLFVVFTERRQALHDLMARTVVLRKGK